VSLWTAAQAQEATGGRAQGHWVATGVSVDFGTLVRGDLYIVTNPAGDGHAAVAAAFEAGAAAALVSRVPDGVAADAPLLIVEDVPRALEALAEVSRARTQARVIAITGTVGKTSTAQMLASMLDFQGRTHASRDACSSGMDVALALARMPQDAKYAIIEMSVDHPGALTPMTRLARPDAALVTTASTADLETFGTLTQLALEHAALFDCLPIGAPAVYDADAETSAIFAAKAHDKRLHGIAFGVHGFDWKLRSVSVQGETTVVQAEFDDAPILFKVGLPGRHFAMNGLGALAVVQAVGADLGQAVAALGQWRPIDGRGVFEVIQLDPVETAQTLALLDNSGSALPVSLAAVLDVLAQTRTTDGLGRFGTGRRIAFLGDMKGLGEDAVALHAGIAHLDSVQKIDVIHCVGPLMRALYDLLPEHRRGAWTETSQQMCDGLRHKVDAGDVVLVKGHSGMKLAAVVDAIRKMGHPVLDM